MRTRPAREGQRIIMDEGCRCPQRFLLRTLGLPTACAALERRTDARIDQDGDPLTHEKGDVYGSLPKVPVGSHGVKLALDQVQKETESLAGGAPIMGSVGSMGAPGSAGAMPPGHPPMGDPWLPRLAGAGIERP